MLTTNNDTDFSLSVLSYLYAGNRGYLSQLNCLQQLGSPDPEPEVIEKIEKDRHKITGWLDETLQGKPIFDLSKQEAEEGGPREAFEMAKEIAADLDELSVNLDRIFKRRDFNAIPRFDHVSILGALIRSHYSRDAYLECYAAYAERLENKEQVKAYKDARRKVKRTIEFTNQLVAAMIKHSELSLEFYHALFRESICLSGLFRTQIHELRMLWNVYNGLFSYQMAGIPDEHAAQWDYMKIAPLEAGYWEAYGLSPDHTRQWMEVGIPEHSVAGVWHLWGFPPTDAAMWLSGKFMHPVDAVDWANAGIPPQEAEQLINRGVSHPSLIKG